MSRTPAVLRRTAPDRGGAEQRPGVRPRQEPPPQPLPARSGRRLRAPGGLRPLRRLGERDARLRDRPVRQRHHRLRGATAERRRADRPLQGHGPRPVRPRSRKPVDPRRLPRPRGALVRDDRIPGARGPRDDRAAPRALRRLVPVRDEREDERKRRAARAAAAARRPRPTARARRTRRRPGHRGRRPPRRDLRRP
jgi:hypothetical protein